MKKVALLLSVISIAFVSCKDTKSKTETVVKETVEIKKEQPKVKKAVNVITWKGYKPTGNHTGTIDVKSSEFKMNDGKLTGGVFVFDMTTIKNGDIKDPSYKSDLENHLKSADFFDVATNPTSKFEITKVIYNPENNFIITGNLTMNGVTKSISFPAFIKDKTFKSKTIKIDRTDFGIKFKSKKFFNNLKDKFINDEFEITFEINM